MPVLQRTKCQFYNVLNASFYNVLNASFYNVLNASYNTKDSDWTLPLYNVIDSNIHLHNI